eukprot:1161378-Pelagomonas_calceolata.AAC.5
MDVFKRWTLSFGRGVLHGISLENFKPWRRMPPRCHPGKGGLGGTRRHPSITFTFSPALSRHTRAHLQQGDVGKPSGVELMQNISLVPFCFAQVCAYNRIEVGKPLGMELMRLLSQNAEAMPVESLISAANAASAIRLQGTPQQLEDAWWHPDSLQVRGRFLHARRLLGWTARTVGAANAASAIQETPQRLDANCIHVTYIQIQTCISCPGYQVS